MPPNTITITSSSWHVTQLPRLLMATASILLEWLLRMRRRPTQSLSSHATSSSTRDRVMVQVLLWFTASLPSTHEATASNATNNNHSRQRSFDLLWNLLFFANLLGIVLPQLVCQTNPFGARSSSRRRNSNTATTSGRPTLLGMCWGSLCYCPIFPNYSLRASSLSAQSSVQGHGRGHDGSRPSRLGCLDVMLEQAPPSLWVALLWAYLDAMNNRQNSSSTEEIQDTYEYLTIAGAVWVVTCCGTWLKRLYQTRRQHQQQQQEQWQTYDHGFPSEAPINTANHHQDDDPLNEAKWHTWTVPQVMEWLSDSFPEQTTIAASFSEDEEFHTTVVPRLAWEGVDGRALEFLDRDALRHMDVPYGVAAPLLDHIQARLIQRYPRPCRASHPNSRVVRNDSSANDGWTLDPPDSHRSSLFEQPDGTSTGPASRGLYMEEEELEQIRTSMKQRYGFELPELASNIAAPRSSEDSGLLLHNQQRSRDATGLGDDESATQTTEAEIDPTALAMMPPHIRAIVAQKPQLWQQVQTLQMEQPNETTMEQTINEPAVPATAQHPAREWDQASEPPMSTPPSATAKIAPELLQNLPPRVKEVALRNPEVFLKMLQSTTTKQQQQKQQGHGQESAMAQSTTSFNPSLGGIDEDLEEENNEELMQLLPKQSNGSNQNGRLRQRPGF